MPYAKCPNCRTAFHLKVTDAESWYTEQNLQFGEGANYICFNCWRPLNVGDKVFEISDNQSVLDTKVQTLGGIIYVEVFEAANIYTVEFFDGTIKQSRREKLYFTSSV
jgi:hypothetical protein